MTIRSTVPHVLLALIMMCILVAVIPSGARAEVLPDDLLYGEPVGADPARVEQSVDLEASAGILTDQNGRVIWSRAGDERHSIASITKVMTCLTALSSGVDLSTEYTVPHEAEVVGGSTGDLKTGDRVRLDDLLRIMLVASGNDAAVTVAHGIAGSSEAFAELMNERAREYGMAGSSFRNPHGLDTDGHYSTPADLMILARKAMDNPFIERVVVTRQTTVTISGVERTLGTTNVLLATYPGMEGIKTGFTRQAGRALLFQVERNGIELTGVVLGTASEKARTEQVTRLMDWAYSMYPYVETVDVRRFGDTVPYAYRPGWMFDIGVGDAAFGHLDRRGAPVEIDDRSPRVLEMRAEEPLGSLLITQEGRIVSSGPYLTYDHAPVEPSLNGALAWSMR